MRVFVTGASGYIGTAVVAELRAAGHEVIGLARSDQSARTLTALGADVVRGAIEDLEVLHDASERADGVIHLAFDNSFSDYAAASAADVRAVETIGDALDGSGKPLVVTSGTLVLATVPGVGTEDDAPDTALPRSSSELAAVGLASRGVRSSVVRLAPCVHDEDRAGLASSLIEIARTSGRSGYVGDGTNRWPGVHRLDAARLFRLALEQAEAGSRVHAVGEVGVALRDVATVIGNRLGLPTVSLGPDEADAHFGFFAIPVSLDNPTSSERTQTRMAWQPVHADLLADLEHGRHFDN